jgi:lipopolysaccharide transport system permease protein
MRQPMGTNHYVTLIIYKAYADLKAEAARGYLGMLWWVLEPVLYLCVFYVVFSVIRHREGDLIPFLLVGLVAWKWFASTVGQGAKSIIGGVGLMQQVYLPKYVFPAVLACTNLIKFLVVLLILLIFLLIYGIYPAVSWLTLPVLVAAQFIMMLAIASLLASIVPFFPDLNQIISNVLTLLFFLSGVIFDISRAPEHIKPFLYLNPMVGMIENYRTILMGGQMPNWLSLGGMLLVSVLIMILAGILLTRFDRIYPKMLVR